MFDLPTFKMSEMIECGSVIRQMGAGGRSMEEEAGRIFRYLYDHFGDRQTGARACALVRLYKTCPYGALDDELKPFARSLFGGVEASPETKCLTLLATAGAPSSPPSGILSSRSGSSPSSGSGGCCRTET